MDLNVTLIGAFGAGLLSFLSPCVLPLVPSYLCFVTGASLDEMIGRRGAMPGRAFLAASLFVLGFSTVFISLGATASAVSHLLRQYQEVLGQVAGALIILAGLHFLGLFRFAFLNRDIRYRQESKPVGLIGAYLVGLAFAFGWTPCIGPILGAILAVAGSSETVGQGAFLLAVYSAGLAVPFLASALAVGQMLGFMKGFRRHLGTVERVMGGALVLTGVLFLSGAIQDAAYWLQEAFPGLNALG